MRYRVSAKAYRVDCADRFIPLKQRTQGEYRDVPMPAFLGEEIDAHMQEWGATRLDGLEVLFARRGWASAVIPLKRHDGSDFALDTSNLPRMP
ncbi:hypothetical protein ACWGCW_07245 [Streptomyces sp. NPDC054933]